MLKFFRRHNTQAVSITPSIVVFTVLFLLFIYFLYSIQSIITWMFLAFIITVALSPVVHKFERYLRFPKVISMIVTYFLMLGLIVGLVALLAPPLVTQMYQLVKLFNFPLLQEELMNARFTVSEISTLVERFGSSADFLFSIVTSTFGGVFTFVTIMVMSFYMMMDRQNLHLKVSWFTKERKHIKAARDFLDNVEHQLGGWVRGQLILMLVIGVVTYIGLILLSVEYALPLALLAATLEILPNLGPTIASVPAIVIAFVTMGPLMAGITALFYILVQQFENNLLVPKVLKDNVDVSPLVSIVSILIGLKLAGIMGAFLAIPTYIVFRTAYSTWFRDMIA